MRQQRASSARPRSALFTGRNASRFLLSASLLLVSSACSKQPLATPTPVLEANLSADCPPLPNPPIPFLDPERSLWAETVIAMYGDCAGRHHATVEAWPKD